MTNKKTLNGVLFTLRVIILTFISALHYYDAHAQGGWFIDYLPVDSVNTSLIGKEIRIDFKSSPDDTIAGSAKTMRIRNLLMSSDSVELTINQVPVKFLEKWRFYVDYGSLNDQMLTVVGKEDTFIKEIFLESIDGQTFTIIASVGNSINRKKEKIVVPRSLVKGVLIRRS